MTKDISTAIKKEFSRLSWLTIVAFVVALAALAGAFYFGLGAMMGRPTSDWLSELGVAAAILIGFAFLAFLLIGGFSSRIRRIVNQAFQQELRQLRVANSRAQMLREMASVLRATLSFERVVEEALNVCSIVLEEMGVPRQGLAGAVFLFSGQKLIPFANRRFLGTDADKSIPGQKGIIGTSFRQADITATDSPGKDPELRVFAAFQNAATAVSIPLRAGYQIFGAMIITSNTAFKLTPDHKDLFDAVADQAVIALQNAQLFQRLETEKQRLIDADEEARKVLARNLHDGPTQSIAAIAMRINFIRSLVGQDPERAMAELQKVESLAKQTSKEIRGMLFTLRPLVLETQGLSAAIETVMKRIEETDGLKMQLVGGENASLLNENAQSVVFSIVEEALGNARKHSEAALIEVRFWKEEGLFVAHVKDDGIGYDTREVNRDYSSRGSLGMVNMQERAERIDGSLRIESTPGKGTTVILVVPLEKHGRKRRAKAKAA